MAELLLELFCEEIPARLQARFPRMIYASLTAYGLEGPDRDAPGYDMAAFSGRSGLAEREGGAELRQLQEIWNLLYRSDRVLAEALVEARLQPLLPAAAELCEFLEASVGPGRRGPLPPPR